MRLTLTALLAVVITTCELNAQTYATLPFTDNLSSGSLGASWSFSDSQGVGTYSVTDLSGGWPNFGTCNVSTCTNVGATGGNGLIVYNSSSPTGSNQLNMDLHMNLDGKGTVELSYAIVDWRSGYDSLAIFLSNNGGSSFTYAASVNLWLSPHVDGTWNEKTHDLQALASATGVSFSSTYVVRFANYLEYTGAATSPKSWPNQSIYYDNFKGTETVPLPVELLYLKGKKNSFGNYLEWATAAEINNDYFIVQRSLDGLTWDNVGKVSGNGNTQTTTNYDFQDTYGEKAYYRLKQVDYDGKYKYSNKVIIGEKGQQIYAQVNNNGDQPELAITGIENGATISIYSIGGKLVESKTLTTTDGYLKYPLNNLSKGTYISTITNNGATISKKITLLK